MAVCNSCGKPGNPEDKFCAGCGQPASQGAYSASAPTPTSSSTTPKKSGLGMPIIVLSVALALAIILGGGATWQWLDNSGQVKELSAETESLTAESADLQSQVSNLSSQVQALTGDKVKLEADKVQLTAELATKISPLKHFASEFQLTNWLAGAITKLNPLDGYFDQHYMLQRLAMDDGYFLSVYVDEDEEFFYAFLLAVAGDGVYLCYDNGEVYPWVYLGT
jgi:outer membrane murein-binding lipoprotein Lpp